MEDYPNVKEYNVYILKSLKKKKKTEITRL